MRNLIAVWIALLAIGGAQRAYASPLFELVGGFGGMGGLQPRHTGASAASTYFNPALLSDAETGISAGVLVLSTNLGISVGTRSPENAVPDGLSLASHANNPLTPLDLVPIASDFLQNGSAQESGLKARPRQHQGSGNQTNTYEAIGIVVKLFKQRLALGFYGLLPNKNFTTLRSFYVDEREQYFSNSLHPELYGDRMTAVSLAFAAGVRLTDTLSLGAGATIALVGKASALAYVANAGRLNDIQLNTDVGARIALVPHAGISWNPGKRWHLTATVHAPQKFDVLADFTFVLATGVEQGSGLAFTYFYQPWQASAGFGYDFYAHGDSVWTASTSFLYGRWSKYIDRQSTRPDGAYTWRDTLTGALGVRMKEGALSMALDGQYKPTPVPEQTGRTNYVDNDRLGMSLSMEYGFELWSQRMKLGAQLATYRLIQRKQTKITPPVQADGVNRTPQLVADEVPDDAVISDQPVQGRDGLQTNNPGWPNFSSMGWVTTAGLYISVAL
jgi:hypothetical protein